MSDCKHGKLEGPCYVCELCQDKDRCVRLVAFAEGGGGS